MKGLIRLLQTSNGCYSIQIVTCAVVVEMLSMTASDFQGAVMPSNNRSWACLYIDKAMSLCLEKDVDLSTYHKAGSQTTLTACEPAFTVAHVSVCSFMMASAINMRSFMLKASSLGRLCVHGDDVIDVHCILLSPSICLL